MKFLSDFSHNYFFSFFQESQSGLKSGTSKSLRWSSPSRCHSWFSTAITRSAARFSDFVTRSSRIWRESDLQNSPTLVTLGQPWRNGDRIGHQMVLQQWPAAILPMDTRTKASGMDKLDLQWTFNGPSEWSLFGPSVILQWTFSSFYVHFRRLSVTSSKAGWTWTTPTNLRSSINDTGRVTRFS